MHRHLIKTTAGIRKNQESMTLPNKTNKFPITDLKKMDSHKLLEIVKIIILKMFREHIGTV